MVLWSARGNFKTKKWTASFLAVCLLLAKILRLFARSPKRSIQRNAASRGEAGW